MLLHPILSVVITLLTRVANLVQYISVQTENLPAVGLPWPVAWLPAWPVVGALVVGVFSAGFFLTVKFTRWAYGLAPFAQ